MARYIGPVCRLCRCEGIKLFLKGERCYTDKCAIERRAYPPGIHGQGHRKTSDYGRQLREKQKVRRMYGVMEKQFRRYYDMASRMKGITGENLIGLLERRLDNVVYRAGLACNRTEARHLIRHGHFELNGRKASIPSILIRPEDVITVRERTRKSKGLERISAALEGAERGGTPVWVETDPANFAATIKSYPVRSDVTAPIEEHLIVELYSK
jgi:small subunit ribosomal protein S4